MQFQLISDEATGEQDLYVRLDGEIHHINSSHMNFDEVKELVLDGEEPHVGLFNVEEMVAARFEPLSERVSVADGQVYFDGDARNDVLTEHLMRLINEGGNPEPLLALWEKIEQNPSEHSRENLYRWLATHSFTIYEDGDILGYKGLTSSGTSIHSGPAIVDGVYMNGQIPYKDGSVVTMARSRVEHNPAVGCSVGLHVGTWAYASGFGSIVKQVKVNPRDVVSVPTDCGDQKMRVARVEIGTQVTAPVTAALA